MAVNVYVPAITLQPDDEQIKLITHDLREIKNGVPRAIAPAINRTLKKGRTELLRGLLAILATKRANIAGRVTTTRATPDLLAAAIRILQRPIGLINFKVQDTRQQLPKGLFGKRALKRLGAETGSGRGVVVQIRKDEPPIRLPKAFIAAGLSENRHVFERYGVKRRQQKAHYERNKGRIAQPIRSFKGESLHNVWKDSPRLRAAVQNLLYTDFPLQIISQVDRLLKRKKSA